MSFNSKNMEISSTSSDEHLHTGSSLKRKKYETNQLHKHYPSSPVNDNIIDNSSKGISPVNNEIIATTTTGKFSNDFHNLTQCDQNALVPFKEIPQDKQQNPQPQLHVPILQFMRNIINEYGLFRGLPCPIRGKVFTSDEYSKMNPYLNMIDNEYDPYIHDPKYLDTVEEDRSYHAKLYSGEGHEKLYTNEIVKPSMKKLINRMHHLQVWDDQEREILRAKRGIPPPGYDDEGYINSGGVRVGNKQNIQNKNSNISMNHNIDNETAIVPIPPQRNNENRSTRRSIRSARNRSSWWEFESSKPPEMKLKVKSFSLGLDSDSEDSETNPELKREWKRQDVCRNEENNANLENPNPRRTKPREENEVLPPESDWLVSAPIEIDHSIKCIENFSVNTAPKATANTLKSISSTDKVDILFHYDSIYKAQELVMTAVAKSMMQGKNSVLESPTGTGKTASLLNSALAAQRELTIRYGSAPQIIYSTRTHGQVKQVVAELKKSPYRPNVVCLGSREKGYCVNEKVMGNKTESDKDNLCQMARNNAGKSEEELKKYNLVECSRHNNTISDNNFSKLLHHVARPRLTVSRNGSNSDIKQQNSSPNHHLDVEDLAVISKDRGCCPYYAAQALAGDAHIIVCSYNYIANPKIRKNSKVEIKNRFIIIDEGHNIEKVCCDGGSCEIPEYLIDKKNNDVLRSVGCLLEKLVHFLPTDWYAMKRITDFFEILHGKMKEWKDELKTGNDNQRGNSDRSQDQTPPKTYPNSAPTQKDISKRTFINIEGKTIKTTKPVSQFINGDENPPRLSSTSARHQKLESNIQNNSNARIIYTSRSWSKAAKKYKDADDNGGSKVDRRTIEEFIRSSSIGSTSKLKLKKRDEDCSRSQRDLEIEREKRRLEEIRSRMAEENIRNNINRNAAAVANGNNFVHRLRRNSVDPSAQNQPEPNPNNFSHNFDTTQFYQPPQLRTSPGPTPSTTLHKVDYPTDISSFELDPSDILPLIEDRKNGLLTKIKKLEPHEIIKVLAETDNWVDSEGRELPKLGLKYNDRWDCAKVLKKLAEILRVLILFSEHGEDFAVTFEPEKECEKESYEERDFWKTDTNIPTGEIDRIKVKENIMRYRYPNNNCVKQKQYRLQPNEKGKGYMNLSFQLLRPSVIFDDIADAAHGVVLASGTLCPINGLFAELGEKFAKNQLQGKLFNKYLSPLDASHVIDKSQLLVQKIGRMSDGTSDFTSTRQQIKEGGKGRFDAIIRQSFNGPELLSRGYNNDLLIQLGRSLIHLVSSIPEGVLVFFPTYSLKKHCWELWHAETEEEKNTCSNPSIFAGFGEIMLNHSNSGISNSYNGTLQHIDPPQGQQTSIISQLELLKGKILVEEQDIPIGIMKTQYQERCVNDPDNRGLLFGVMRGKCSEGISFNNGFARGVIIIGLCLPSLHAPNIVHKKAYNNYRCYIQTQQGNERELARLEKADAHQDGGVANEPAQETNIVLVENPAASSSSSAAPMGSSSVVNHSPADTLRFINDTEWYNQQAMRPTNQALGRCIRHINDYGALFLIDQRWNTDLRWEKQLATWMKKVGVKGDKEWKKNVDECRDYKVLKQEIGKFFEMNQIKHGRPTLTIDQNMTEEDDSESEI